MDGIERANWLHRERAADPSENRVCDTDEVTATREDVEPAYCGALVRLTQPPGGAPADDGASRFRKRECRRDTSAGGADRRPRGRIMLQ